MLLTITAVNDDISFTLRGSGSGVFDASTTYNSFPVVVHDLRDATLATLRKSLTFGELVDGNVETGEPTQRYDWSISTEVVENIRGGTGTGTTILGTVFSSAPSITGGMDLSSGAPTGVRLDYTAKLNAEAVVKVTISARDSANALLYGSPLNTIARADVYFVIRDRSSPRIVSFSPGRRASPMSPLPIVSAFLDLLVLEFDEEVRKLTSDDGKFIKINYTDQDDIAQEVSFNTYNDSRLSFDEEQVVISIIPPIQIKKNSELSIRIDSASFIDKAGINASIPGVVVNSFNSKEPPASFGTPSDAFGFWRLRTIDAPPAIVTTFPTEGAEDVQVRPTIVFNFDEDITLDSRVRLIDESTDFGDLPDSDMDMVPDSTIIISSVSLSTPLAFRDTLRIRVDTMVLGRQLSLSLLGNLPGNSRVMVSLPKGVIRSRVSGLATGADIEVSFETSNVPRFRPFFPTGPLPGSIVSPRLGDTLILASYNEPVLKGDAGAVHVFARRRGGSHFVEILTLLSASDRLGIRRFGLGADSVLEIRLPNLSANADYRVTIDEGVVGLDQDVTQDGIPDRVLGNSASSVEGSSWEFSTGLFPNPPRPVPAELVGPWSTNAAVVGDTIIISYNEPIEKGPDTKDIKMYILINDLSYEFATIPTSSLASSRSLFVSGRDSGFVSGRFVHIKYPGGRLPYGATFYLLAEEGAFRNYSGGSSVAVLDNSRWRFTTNSLGDDQGPRIVAASISNGGVIDAGYNIDIVASKHNASLRPVLRLTFDEGLHDVLGSSDIMLRSGTECGSGSLVFTIATDAVRVSGSSAFISVLSELSYNTDYTLEVPLGRFSDVVGNVNSGLCYTFRTRLSAPDYNSIVGVSDDTVVVEYRSSTFDAMGSPFVPQVSFTSSLYSDIMWGWEELSLFSPVLFSPVSVKRPTYFELSSVATSLVSSSFSVPIDDAEDIGIYTYKVWNGGANGQISDTTTLTLVILDTAGVEVSVESLDSDRDGQPLRAIIRSSSSDTYNLSFSYDDGFPVLGSAVDGATSVQWSTDGVTYNPMFEVSDDGLTRSLFAPAGVAFDVGEDVRRVGVFVRLRNEATGASYVSLRREITVSRSKPFLARYVKAGVSRSDVRYTGPRSVSEVELLPSDVLPLDLSLLPSVPSEEFPLRAALGICQGSGSYDLLEFSPSVLDGGSLNLLYRPYSQSYLEGRFTDRVRGQEFDNLSSEIAGFVERPVSVGSGFRVVSFGSPTLYYDSLLVEAPLNGIDSLPWRLNTDSVLAVSGSRTIIVQRFSMIEVDDMLVSTPVGFAEVLVYQSPRIQVLNVKDRYCRGDVEAIDVGVRILRDGPGDMPIEGRLPGSSKMSSERYISGRFEVYIATSSSGNGLFPHYLSGPSAIVDALDFMDGGFSFTGSYFYGLSVGSPDTVFVRLEYISSGVEDVGPYSSCIGVGIREFRVYNTPSAPMFSYGSGSRVYRNSSEGDREEVLYCEGSGVSPAVISVKGFRSDESYTWYEGGGISPLLIGSSYTPSLSLLSDASLRGDGTMVYTYDATRVRHADASAGFRGCESARGKVYLVVVGRPEVEISNISYRRGGFRNSPGSGRDPLADVSISLDRPSVCIGRVLEDGADDDVEDTSDDFEDNSQFKYHGVKLVIDAKNTKVFSDGGSFRGVGGFISTLDNGVELDFDVPTRAVFDVLQAVRGRIRSRSISLDPMDTDPIVPLVVTDFVSGVFEEDEEVEVSYKWDNVYGKYLSDSSISCSSVVSKTIEVNRLPAVEFSAVVGGSTFRSGVSNSAEVCVDTEVFNITREASHGNINMSFYIDREVQPQVRGTMEFDADAVRLVSVRRRGFDLSSISHRFTRSTSHIVTYLASSTEGCYGFVSDTLMVHSVAALAFSPGEGCRAKYLPLEISIFNEDSLVFDGNGISEFVWDFGAFIGSGLRSETRRGDERRIVRPFGKGRHEITLSARTEKGCETTRTKVLDVGVLPDPELSWEGGTEGGSIDFKFYESSLSLSRTKALRLHVEQNGVQLGGAIVDREVNSLDFVGDDDGGARELLARRSLFNSLRYNPVMDGDGSGALVSAGVYELVLSVTSTVNCIGRKRREIRIFPNVVVGEEGYRMDFDRFPEHWYSDTLYVINRSARREVETERGKPVVIVVNKDEDGNDRARPNSWSWGAVESGSTYIRGLPGTNNRGAWFTKVFSEDGLVRHGYRRSERSWLYSPSFDLRGLSRPTVEFDLIYEFRDKDHGAVIQYSTDDGRSWEVLGNYDADDLGSGIGWYTHDDIDALPGTDVEGVLDGGINDSKVGWAASSDAGAGNWLLSRHRLEVIPLLLRDSVRFRFALAGVDAPIGESEGIGIDNFWIGNRTKVVVVEEFSTEIMSDARVLHETISRYMDGRGDSGEEDAYASSLDALRITYYGFPSDNPGNRSDRFYELNPEEVNVRQVYYGVLDVPTAILEGDFTRNSRSVVRDIGRPPWSLNALNRSSLARPEASISLEATTESQEIHIDVKVSLTDAGVAQEISGEHRLHIAVIECNVEVLGAPSGQALFRDVFRKMLPNAAGTPIVFNATHDTTEVSVSWEVFSTYLSSRNRIMPEEVRLSVVAFVQSSEDKRIYQASVSDLSIEMDQLAKLLGENEATIQDALRLYPNPVSDRLYIGGLQGNSLVHISTLGGIVVQSADVSASASSIDVSNLPGGTYVVVIERSEAVPSRRLVIIK